MPVYDLSDRAQRSRLAQELHNPGVMGWIIRRHYGEDTLRELREDWRACVLSQRESLRSGD